MKNSNAGMKDKILFWIDIDLIHFGIAKLIQEKYDCDSYAIIDVNNISKDFFLKQNFIKFKKVWYYRDYLKKEKSDPNIDYLKSFESKYGINLWEIILIDPYFNQFNKYYKFNEKEILKILEQECKFFEKVLDEVKPNFLIIKVIDYHHNHLLHDICKMKGIPILMLSSTRSGYRSIISKDLDEPVELKNDELPELNKHQLNINLNSYRKKFDRTKKEKEDTSKELASQWKRLKSSLKFLLFVCNNNYRNYYANYGRTRLKIIIKEIPFLFKRLCRESFLNKHTMHEISEGEPFVYFPMHVEPERSMAIKTPYYSNQHDLIFNIAKSLPIGFRLYVKEHMKMKRLGWRPISYYKKILNLPNVRLLHPSITTDEILKKSSLVVTIGGTTGFEAAFYKKPTIVLSDMSYSLLSSVYRLKNIEDLPNAIRMMLTKQLDYSDFEKLVKIMDKNSFEFDYWGLILELFDYIFQGGFLRDREIPEEKFMTFFNKHKDQLEKAAVEHIKKINQYKEKRIL